MTPHFTDQLRTTDPVNNEHGLSPAEVQVMRRAIVTAASDRRHPRWSTRSATMMVAAALTVVVGVFVGTLFESGSRQADLGEPIENRQLQFVTPGGTRVVWVLNDNFDLPKDRQP